MIQAELSQQIADICADLYSKEVEPEITYPGGDFGDFTSNVALQIGSDVGDSPREVAAQIVAEFEHESVSVTEVAGPGFINFTMTEGFWLSQLNAVNGSFARSNLGQGQKVQVEFISANPTGPLTLGNARGGFVGDVLASVLEASGYGEVVREYYFNDAGTQIDKLAQSVWRQAQLKEIKPGEPAPDADVEYQGDYISRVAEKVAYDFENPQEEGFKSAVTGVVFEDYIRPAISNMNIEFDWFFNEKKLDPQWQQVKKMLDQAEMLEKRDGALWLLSNQFGDERDRVLVKQNGDRTYLANDLAYHYNIFQEWGFDRAIKVWGADHAGQVSSLNLSLKQLLDNPQLAFVIVQWVRLIQGGQEVKVSKREGNIVTVNELIEEVGADVARWFMLSRSNDTHMDFDLDLAKEESQKNPYWYVMYAYTRTLSLLDKAEHNDLQASTQVESLNEYEYKLTRQLMRLPGLVENIAENYEVHKLTFWGREVARLFHDYYEQERIIDMPAGQAANKLAFLEQFKQVMEIYFDLLGIEPREEM